MLFSFLLHLISSWLHGSCSVFAPGVLWFLCFVLHTKTIIFDFFGLKLSNCFPVKTHVFGKLFIFCTFCLSWPAKTKKKNSSEHDFLVLVLQSSHSSNLKAFSKFASVYSLLLAWVHVQFLTLGSCGFFALFSMGGVELLNFFVWNHQTVSPLKLNFSEGPSFFVRSVCNHWA